MARALVPDQRKHKQTNATDISRVAFKPSQTPPPFFSARSRDPAHLSPFASLSSRPRALTRTCRPLACTYEHSKEGERRKRSLLPEKRLASAGNRLAAACHGLAHNALSRPRSLARPFARHDEHQFDTFSRPELTGAPDSHFPQGTREQRHSWWYEQVVVTDNFLGTTLRREKRQTPFTPSANQSAGCKSSRQQVVL